MVLFWSPTLFCSSLDLSIVTIFSSFLYKYSSLNFQLEIENFKLVLLSFWSANSGTFVPILMYLVWILLSKGNRHLCNTIFIPPIIKSKFTHEICQRQVSKTQKRKRKNITAKDLNCNGFAFYFAFADLSLTYFMHGFWFKRRGIPVFMIFPECWTHFPHLFVMKLKSFKGVKIIWSLWVG